MRYRCARAVVLLAGIAAAGCGATPAEAPPTARAESTTPAPAAAQVVIDNFAYAPREITVAPGTRVTWVNRDDVPHTATSSVKPRAFDSGALDTDDAYSFTFTTPGTYDYFCAVHPHMAGRVIVK
jgi:plastocyanin